MSNRKIWIDLDNSPHVPFFKPIIEELNKHGYKVMLTARDCSQTCELADLFNLRYKKIGRHYGKNKIIKLFGLLLRAFQLMPTVMKEKPVIALSHGSRSQLILSSILRIPAIQICDYEHARNSLPFASPDWFIVPEIITDSKMKLSQDHILKYPGIKEDVYVPNFKPDPHIKDELGITGNDLIVTIRPPATDAHYFDPASEELFESLINYLVLQNNIRMIILPRNKKQSAFIRGLWYEWFENGKIMIPDEVINGLNLLWYSDLVISGGGTMNREAAALRVPVYSIFKGKIGAVDRFLSESGRLIFLESVEDIKTKVSLVHTQRDADVEPSNNATLNSIVTSIISAIES